jgi:WD40 repeat protein
LNFGHWNLIASRSVNRIDDFFAMPGIRMRSQLISVLFVGLAAGCSGSDDARAPQGGHPAGPATTHSRANDVPPEASAAELIFSGEDGTYIARADGLAVRKAFDLQGVWEFQPDVSPDGKRVALRADEEPPRGGTWLVGIDGSNPINLSRQVGVWGGAADWSPDGRSLVYTGKRKGERFFGLWIVRTDGSRARRITPDTWEAQYPAWSPDAKSIAFTRVVPPDDFSLYVLSPDGAGLRKVSQGDHNDNYAAWSPDGKQLVFNSERSEGAGLWLINADGTGERFLTEGGEPQWEPRRLIIFDCPVGSDDPARGCVISPDGSALTELPIDRQVAFPNWLP